MKKGIFKFFSRTEIFFLVLIMLFALGSAGLVGASYIVDGFDAISWVYLLIGEFIAPIELLINGSLGSFYESTMNIVCICVALAIFVFCILLIKTYSKNGKKNKSNGFVANIVLSLLLMGYFAFNLVMLILNYAKINRYFGRNISGIAEIVINYTFKDFVIVKGIGVLSIIAGLAFVIFILTFICKEKKKKQHLAKQESLSFYSDKYLVKDENKTENQPQEIKGSVEQNAKPKIKKQNQELINKIMHLNELKDKGQITDVEYTKLRQKAIRRYKWLKKYL